MNAGDEEVRACVGRAVLVVLIAFRSTVITATVLALLSAFSQMQARLPIAAPIHRLVANACVAITVWSWRARAIASVVAVICYD